MVVVVCLCSADLSATAALSKRHVHELMYMCTSATATKHVCDDMQLQYVLLVLLLLLLLLPLLYSNIHVGHTRPEGFP